MLFLSSTQAMNAYTKLHGAGCDVRIAPAPRLENVCCGTALLIRPDGLPGVEAQLAKDASIAFDRIIETEDITDIHRDRFC